MSRVQVSKRTASTTLCVTLLNDAGVTAIRKSFAFALQSGEEKEGEEEDKEEEEEEETQTIAPSPTWSMSTA